MLVYFERAGVVSHTFLLLGLTPTTHSLYIDFPPMPLLGAVIELDYELFWWTSQLIRSEMIMYFVHPTLCALLLVVLVCDIDRQTK